jgi:hypothetical protein
VGSSSISGTASRTGCTSDAERELPEAALATLKLGGLAAFVLLVAAVGALWGALYGVTVLFPREDTGVLVGALLFLLVAPAAVFGGPLAAFAVASTGRRPGFRELIVLAARRSLHATLFAVPESIYLAFLIMTAVASMEILHSVAYSVWTSLGELACVAPFLTSFYFLSRRALLYLTLLLVPGLDRIAARQIVAVVWIRQRRRLLLAGLLPAVLIVTLTVGPSRHVEQLLGINGAFARVTSLLVALPFFVLLETLVFASVLALEPLAVEPKDS